MSAFLFRLNYKPVLQQKPVLHLKHNLALTGANVGFLLFSWLSCSHIPMFKINKN